MEMGLKLTHPCGRCNSTVNVNFKTFVYYCRKQHNNKICGYRRKLTLAKLIGKFKLELKTYVRIIFDWTRSIVPKQVASELNINVASVNKFYSKLNHLAADYLHKNSQMEIGGPGRIVEIDESKFVRRKGDRGRFLATEEWVFGGVERGNWANYFFVFVPDRKFETLGNEIAANIAPESIIYSDEWPAYKKVFETLTAFDYEHKTVCHKRNWVNPETGVHTQNIEGFWSYIKRELRKSGSNRGKKNSILKKVHAICFKRIYGDYGFQNLLKEMVK